MRDEDWGPRRAHMVDRQIRARGIRDLRVLGAMQAVPRERFVPRTAQPEACADRALAIGLGQTISQPYMVAAMTQALDLSGGERVLEVGTGSGYQTAVLATLAAQVYTVERIPELAGTARHTLADLGYANVSFRVHDGTLGWPDEAPFDAILVAAGAPEAPPSLTEQLCADGGRLVIPLGGEGVQELTRLVRNGAEIARDALMGCRFVPLIGEEGW